MTYGLYDVKSLGIFLVSAIKFPEKKSGTQLYHFSQVERLADWKEGQHRKERLSTQFHWPPLAIDRRVLCEKAGIRDEKIVISRAHIVCEEPSKKSHQHHPLNSGDNNDAVDLRLKNLGVLCTMRLEERGKLV